MSEPRKIVCLIGSSRFKDYFHRIGATLEKRGVLVLMMSFFQHADGVSVSDEERAILREVDKFRIDLSHEVHVVNGMVRICNKCGMVNPAIVSMDADVFGKLYSRCCLGSFRICPYIGEDTQREIDYATAQGKPITYMENSKT